MGKKVCLAVYRIYTRLGWVSIKIHGKPWVLIILRRSILGKFIILSHQKIAQNFLETITVTSEIMWNLSFHVWGCHRVRNQPSGTLDTCSAPVVISGNTQVVFFVLYGLISEIRQFKTWKMIRKLSCGQQVYIIKIEHKLKDVKMSCKTKWKGPKILVFLMTCP